MSDWRVEFFGEELAAILRAPIKLEPISPPSSPNPLFQTPMSRMKSTASRGGRGSLIEETLEKSLPGETHEQPHKIAEGTEQLVPVLPNPSDQFLLLLLKLWKVPRRN